MIKINDLSLASSPLNCIIKWDESLLRTLWEVWREGNNGGCCCCCYIVVIEVRVGEEHGVKENGSRCVKIY